MIYHSLQELVSLSESNAVPLWQVILTAQAEESGIAESDIFDNMAELYSIMADADQNYEDTLRSESGMSGGDGALLHKYNLSGQNICGPFLSLAMEKALKMAESNACMKRIVAAPTAGSCGVIPALLLSYEEIYHPAKNTLVEALLITAGIGAVFAENASIAGAAGGCQAEIGTASAMAAGALTYLQSGTAEEIVHASALAMKNMLGLACDPVGGLVEIPCIKRNVSGVVNAITSAQLARAGIRSAISPDDVVDSMRRIGNDLPSCLKETGTGGLAVTPSAKALVEASKEKAKA